jgi:hypothetical protein
MLFATKTLNIMTTNLVENYHILQGDYVSFDKTLVNSRIGGMKYLVIGTRKTPTPSKPINYLLQKLSASYKYITSMYPTSTEGHYKLEHKGVSYDMVRTEIGYTITPIDK